MLSINRVEAINECVRKPCILCSQPSYVVTTFSKRRIMDLYNKICAVTNSVHGEFYAFDLRHCGTCQLVFADPMKAGSSAFYRWILGQANYYPGLRWEWSKIEEELRGLSSHDLVLDVGCGTGDFILYLVKSLAARLQGIDQSTGSVTTCLAGGLDARVATIDDLAADRANHGVYAAVTMTHVLEHVPNPVETMLAAKRLVRRGGRIFASTPYSPMASEMEEFDPKNLPPHHLTRWRYRSYETLGRLLGMKFSIHMPGISITRTALTNTWRRFNGRKGGGRMRKIHNALIHPLYFTRALAWLRERDIIREQRAANVILAVFQKS